VAEHAQDRCGPGDRAVHLRAEVGGHLPGTEPTPMKTRNAVPTASVRSFCVMVGSSAMSASLRPELFAMMPM